MRFIAKFYVVAILAAFAIIYFCYNLSNSQSAPAAPVLAQTPAAAPGTPQTYAGNTAPAEANDAAGKENAQKEESAQNDQKGSKPSPTPAATTSSGFKNRFVVFGDSSSHDSLFTSPLRGRVWTDWFCSQYECTRESYAQASDKSISIVNSKELELLGQKQLLPAEPLPDLAAQVDLFINNERQHTKGMAEQQLQERRDSTIFTIAFGLWDVWRLIDKPDNAIQDSIQRSTDMIFKQISRLVDEFKPQDVKIILMSAIDVTFLPAYTPAQGDRQVVEISEKWNKELHKRTEQFKQCSIFLVDTQSFIVDQFRAKQLWQNGYIETSEYGKDAVAWVNVRDACMNGADKKTFLFFGSKAQCSDPEKYLFWDSMHLSSSAQKLLGTDIYKDIEPLWLSKKGRKEEPKEEPKQSQQ